MCLQTETATWKDNTSLLTIVQHQSVYIGSEERGNVLWQEEEKAKLGSHEIYQQERLYTEPGGKETEPCGEV